MLEFKNEIIKFTEPKTRSFFPESFSNEIYFSSVKNMNRFKYESAFSIKYVIDGFETYRVGQIIQKIKTNQYLIVNDGQEVETRDAEASAISIFLDKILINDVVHNLDEREELLLDRPFNKKNKTVNFFETVYPKHNSLGAYLKKFSTSQLQRSSFNINEELFYSIALQLVTSQISIKNEIKKIDRIKYSTRCELYKRVLKAKLFIEENLNNPFSLELLSKACHMSKFHLIRIFKNVYKTTPYNYYLHLKIERSKPFLLQTNYSITEIAALSGFNDIASFSRRFKSETGCTPIEFRFNKMN